MTAKALSLPWWRNQRQLHGEGERGFPHQWYSDSLTYPYRPYAPLGALSFPTTTTLHLSRNAPEHQQPADSQDLHLGAGDPELPSPSLL